MSDEQTPVEETDPAKVEADRLTKEAEVRNDPDNSLAPVGTPYVGTDPMYQNTAYGEQEAMLPGNEKEAEIFERARKYEEGMANHTIPGILPEGGSFADFVARQKESREEPVVAVKVVDDVTEADTSTSETESGTETPEPTPPASSGPAYGTFTGGSTFSGA